MHPILLSKYNIATPGVWLSSLEICNTTAASFAIRELKQKHSHKTANKQTFPPRASISCASPIPPTRQEGLAGNVASKFLSKVLAFFRSVRLLIGCRRPRASKAKYWCYSCVYMYAHVPQCTHTIITCILYMQRSLADLRIHFYTNNSFVFDTYI